MTPDLRKLSERVDVLSRRFAAQAIGHRKLEAQSRQLAENAERDAAWLAEAVKFIRERGA